MSGFNTSGILSFAPARMIIPILLVLTWYLGRLHSQYEPIVVSKVSSRLEEARKMMPNIKLDWPIPPTKDPRAAFNSSKLALLIEARPLPHLPPLMLHMMAVVPPDWRFLFIGSNGSITGVSQAYSIKHQQVIGKLDLMELPLPWNISSKENVFRLLTDSRFYDEFLPGVEWILKYEPDSILCANSEISVDDWLDWDWTGAARIGDERFSGYGGLSLRRVSVVKRILNFQARFNDSEPEDEWFGKRLWVLPDAKVASTLDDAIAVEDVYKERPMGYHVREGSSNLNEDMWGDAARRKETFEYCPELSMIMDMKLERQRCPDDDGNGVREEADVEMTTAVMEEGDVDVTTAVLGEGEFAKMSLNDAESEILPPQPPPLPQPWKAYSASVTTFRSPLRTGIN
ncbi:hypothetical protein THAR02_09886 [Trichoderma harzianum]|uniref:DUF5672 domain-containing protein n=1 Tax=Trichoderma harzianum TaxID=5544 RepID=A0A0F9XBK3_TRIHA|nr:hypothetical protein THAR02_09886 [Trichoderma harzianum]